MPEQTQPAFEESGFEVEEWLAEWLTGAPAARAVHCGRVFPVFIPASQDRATESIPALVYRRTKTTRGQTMKGADGLAKSEFQLTCVARSNKQGYKQNCQLARAVRLTIDGWKGTDKGHNIRGVILENEFDNPVPPMFGDEIVTHQRVLIVEVRHTEQVKFHQVPPS